MLFKISNSFFYMQKVAYFVFQIFHDISVFETNLNSLGT